MCVSFRSPVRHSGWSCRICASHTLHTAILFSFSDTLKYCQTGAAILASLFCRKVSCILRHNFTLSRSAFLESTDRSVESEYRQNRSIPIVNTWPAHWGAKCSSDIPERGAWCHILMRLLLKHYLLNTGSLWRNLWLPVGKAIYVIKWKCDVFFVNCHVTKCISHDVLNTLKKKSGSWIF